MINKLSSFLFTFFLYPSVVLAQSAESLGIGTIETPPGVEKYQEASGADIGIIYFISNIIRVFAVVAGVWVLFNVVLAGYTYLSSDGSAGNHEKVRNQITNSVLGLLLIVISYTVGGAIGLIFFGDAGFILNPELPRAIP